MRAVAALVVMTFAVAVQADSAPMLHSDHDDRTGSDNVLTFPHVLVRPASPVEALPIPDVRRSLRDLDEVSPPRPAATGSAEAASLASNGIPAPTLAAYQDAAAAMASADPSCHLDWTLLAAIGRVESDHGRFGDSVVTASGVSVPDIVGIALDGSGETALIRDTDGGRFDGDTVYDRAVGPMQFLPGTWSVVGRDADGDGANNPQDIDDAAQAAAVYLCAGSRDLSTRAGAWSAVYSYNHSASYVALVLSLARQYADGDVTEELPGTPGTTIDQAGPSIGAGSRPTDNQEDSSVHGAHAAPPPAGSEHPSHPLPRISVPDSSEPATTSPPTSPPTTTGSPTPTATAPTSPRPSTQPPSTVPTTTLPTTSVPTTTVPTTTVPTTTAPTTTAPTTVPTTPPSTTPTSTSPPTTTVPTTPTEPHPSTCPTPTPTEPPTTVEVTPTPTTPTPTPPSTCPTPTESITPSVGVPQVSICAGAPAEPAETPVLTAPYESVITWLCW